MIEVSPSQWSLFEDCFRRGAFSYVARLPDPGGEGARRGTRVHGRVEDYLQGIGRPLDPDDLEDSMALALARYLPAPGTAADLARRGVVIEGEIKFEHGGVKYNGRKDLEWWDDFEEREGLVVTDHKTGASFDYALTREQLRKHVQPVLYAMHSLLKHADQERLRLEWNYVLSRRPPSTRPVVTDVSREHVEREMVAIDDFSKLIVEVREEGQAIAEKGSREEVLAWVNTLPHDESLTSCKKYGKEGCPYKRQCDAHGVIPAIDLVRMAFRRKPTLKKENDDMGKLDELRARMAAKEAAKAEVAPKVEVAPAAQQAPAEQPAPPKFTPPTGRTFAAPPPSPGHTGVAPVREPEPAKVAEGALAAPAEPEKAPDQETKKTRTPRSKPAAEVAKFTSDVKTAGFTLAINALFLKGGRTVVLLSDYLRPVHAVIASELNVPHYSAIEFGKGRAVLTEALEAHMYTPEGNLDGCTLIVDSRTAEGADALPVLERRATEVCRGF